MKIIEVTKTTELPKVPLVGKTGATVEQIQAQYEGRGVTAYCYRSPILKLVTWFIDEYEQHHD